MPYVLITPNVQRMVYLLDVFEEELSKVYVSGNKKVTLVTLCEDKGKYHLMVQGNGFLEVLGTRGVNLEIDPLRRDKKMRYKSRSNNIHEVAAVLGIEAARRCIIDEIKTTIQSHGITIDERHLMMLADTMTASGNIVGMTRAGFSKVKTSTIKMASVSSSGVVWRGRSLSHKPTTKPFPSLILFCLNFFHLIFVVCFLFFFACLFHTVRTNCRLFIPILLLQQ